MPAAVVYLKALAGLNVPVSSAYYLSRFLTPEVWLAILSGLDRRRAAGPGDRPMARGH